TSIYQSNGLCQNFCEGNYAFAVLQDNGCWCSDYVPGETTSVGDCSEPCPGYPPDLCGGHGLFGYIALNEAPSGTKGASSSDQAPSTSSTSEAPPQTSTDPPPTSAPPTTSSSSSTWSPTPVTSVITVTGQAQTIVVTPTAPPDQIPSKQSKGGLGTGASVGLAIGLVALCALIAAFVFLYIRRRRQEANPAGYDIASRSGSSGGFPGAAPSRSMSENSRYVLGTDGRQVIETWEPDDLNKPGSRKSRLMPVDPRLDPFAPVYQRGGNPSRDSVNTIQDNHDYSRRVHQQGPILRATNPDVDAD
ncbi:hypothetical protein DH86_00001226, partial [Scytalidium sp. 3C]